MNELTTYREVLGCKGTDDLTGFHHWICEHGGPCWECGAEQVWVVPDTRLQAIAEAPRCEHGKIDRHVYYVLDSDGVNTYHSNGCVVTAWCEGAPELRAKLNALVEGEQP